MRYKYNFKKIVGLYNKPMSLKEVSDKLGLPELSMRAFLLKHGFKLRSHEEAYNIALLKGKVKRTQIKIPKEKWKLAYLAGLIDGEGSVYVGKAFSNRNIPNVRVVNTDKKMIEWVVKNFGGNITFYTANMKHPTWLPKYRWEISSIFTSLEILKAILPYLITKRENAVQVIGFCEKKLKEWESKYE